MYSGCTQSCRHHTMNMLQRHEIGVGVNSRMFLFAMEPPTIWFVSKAHLPFRLNIVLRKGSHF